MDTENMCIKLYKPFMYHNENIKIAIKKQNSSLKQAPALCCSNVGDPIDLI